MPAPVSLSWSTTCVPPTAIHCVPRMASRAPINMVRTSTSISVVTAVLKRRSSVMTELVLRLARRRRSTARNGLVQSSTDRLHIEEGISAVTARSGVTANIAFGSYHSLLGWSKSLALDLAFFGERRTTLRDTGSGSWLGLSGFVGEICIDELSGCNEQEKSWHYICCTTALFGWSWRLRLFFHKKQIDLTLAWFSKTFHTQPNGNL